MADNTNQKNSMEKGIGGSPKNLMVPFLLLSLRGGFGLHGYKLIQQLTQLGFSSIDQGNVYRLLRQLEKDNLVKSEWDTTSSGPAKRIYSITDVGLEYLDLWAESLGQYQTMLDSFFTMYSNMFMPLVPKGKKEDPDEK
ncbi:transcriptional regulator, PadR family [Schinkia azotoformans MEV2011]|uniref:Poly-beta-hydroxybutyrate-responsive repressor n=2 Tax=Schinkia azotoformans TaxID=1454 RepID=K6D5I8_SCHAZ|nr:poly-beta-hydroxybutyrate-responsive repressor [Schinkia azotoformans]EKN67787.1 poly-beta-hydroxybutyrate-responsive repressor [Schinkia azotoformans LMG 9581]KEF40210.1 transcriptional regulator, PadR family [Schinkia azotoformans MEV2011]